MMKKNELIQLYIEDMSVDGAGIGHADGFTFFVKDTMIGDEALVQITKLKKTYGYARLYKLLKPSADRVEAKCKFARPCGGCQIQEMAYHKQLRFKENKVRQNLERLGAISSEQLDQIMEPIIGMDDPWRYRNKAQFPFGTNKDGKVVCGFYAGRTHNIIEIEDCPIGIRENYSILQIVLEYMERYHVSPYEEATGTGLIRHVLIRSGFHTGEIMVCFVINGTNLPNPENLLSRLKEVKGMKSICISQNKKRTNVIMGDSYEVIWGEGYITDKIGENTYRLSPLSFYQVNPKQTEKLYEKALMYAGLTGREIVWDLYCGIGTISLFLARQAEHVYGVEIIPQAVEDARENALINGIENVTFFAGKAEEIVPEYIERTGRADDKSDKDSGGRRPDVVVVDPPRKGLAPELLEAVAAMEPDRIVYVSCDSATLARDVRLLSERGYELKRAQPVDQFGHSVHVECVCLMTRVR